MVISEAEKREIESKLGSYIIGGMCSEDRISEMVLGSGRTVRYYLEERTGRVVVIGVQEYLLG